MASRSARRALRVPALGRRALSLDARLVRHAEHLGLGRQDAVRRRLLLARPCGRREQDGGPLVARAHDPQALVATSRSCWRRPPAPRSPTRPCRSCMRWSPTPHAVKYEVTISADPGLAGNAVTDAGKPFEVSATSLSVPAALGAGTYYWAVTPMDANGLKGRRSAHRVLHVVLAERDPNRLARPLGGRRPDDLRRPPVRLGPDPGSSQVRGRGEHVDATSRRDRRSAARIRPPAPRCRPPSCWRTTPTSRTRRRDTTGGSARSTSTGTPASGPAARPSRRSSTTWCRRCRGSRSSTTRVHPCRPEAPRRRRSWTGSRCRAPRATRCGWCPGSPGGCNWIASSAVSWGAPAVLDVVRNGVDPARFQRVVARAVRQLRPRARQAGRRRAVLRPRACAGRHRHHQQASGQRLDDAGRLQRPGFHLRRPRTPAGRAGRCCRTTT